MKAFLLTTGTVFALLTVAHVWRIVFESRALASEPWFMLTTVLSAALSVWAFVLARRTAKLQ
jgi:Co/Zn/Cd efflux system component